MARTVVAPLFKDRMSREVDLPILSDESVRPDKYGCVVDYSFDSAFFRHAKHDVQPMLSSKLLDPLDTGSRNRFS